MAILITIKNNKIKSVQHLFKTHKFKIIVWKLIAALYFLMAVNVVVENINNNMKNRNIPNKNNSPFDEVKERATVSVSNS